MIAIQTTIIGYSGKPCTLFSAYDEASNILVLSVEASYRRDRREGCLIITNDPEIDRDTLFVEDYLKDAISAYFFLLQGVASDGKSSKLTLSDKAQRANPANSIEKDGMDSNGNKYRIAENITCAQIAALATCWQITKVVTASKILDMADQIIDIENDFNAGLNAGEIFTI